VGGGSDRIRDEVDRSLSDKITFIWI